MNNDGDGDSDGSDCEFVIDSQFSAETREAYECCEDAFECSLCKNEDGIKHRRVDVENEVWTKCDQVRLHIHTEICADVLFVTEQKLPFVRLLDLYWECKELQRSIESM